MTLSGKSKKAAVLGWPVSHSLSPKLHGWWLNHYRIDGSYEAIPVKPEDLAATLKSLPAQGFAGCNLTVPHKEEALLLMDDISAEAKAIGAVNTVIVRAGKLYGTNTDAYGFMENLRAAHAIPEVKKALVIGAGGAARAIVYALLQEGFSVAITNRTKERAEALKKDFPLLSIVEWEARNAAMKDIGLLVNTTSLGMKGQPPLELSLEALAKAAVVTDIVYSPLQTGLLKAAAARGNRTVDGLGMLLYQAAAGFEAWFGRKPEVTQAQRDFVLEAA